MKRSLFGVKSQITLGLNSLLWEIIGKMKAQSAFQYEMYAKIVLEQYGILHSLVHIIVTCLALEVSGKDVELKKGSGCSGNSFID